MAQDRMSQALERIDKAFARIEAAASRAPAASGNSSAELDSLRQAHQALRGKIHGAIQQIDRLLEVEG